MKMEIMRGKIMKDYIYLFLSWIMCIVCGAFGFCLFLSWYAAGFNVWICGLVLVFVLITGYLVFKVLDKLGF